uniref:Nuclear pore protein n=1 Tax=Pristionchus pacificus TaxID=54126 RepID=A0A8R1V4D7_PRIPA
MPGAFDDLLSRADKLNSVGAVEAATIGQKRVAPDALSDDLSQIFRSSEFLLKKKSVASSTQSLLFGGERGLIVRVAPPALTPAAPSTAAAAAARAALEDDVEYEAELEERSRLQIERAFFNQTLLSNPLPSLKPPGRKDKENMREPASASRFVAQSGEVTRRELLYGDRIRKYIQSSRRKPLDKMLLEATTEGGASENLEIAWHSFAAMFGDRLATHEEPARSNELVRRATGVLEKQFCSHMRDCVSRSLERAQMGGVPSMRSLIMAYLKVHGTSSGDLEGGVSAWELAYHALRAGEVAAAKEALSSLAHFPRSAVLVAALNQLAGQPRLNEETKMKLRTEWRHEQSHVGDVHQRALYAALLGLEPTHVSNLEEWLWGHLVALRVDPALPAAIYADLQKQIAVDLGESYFMQGGASAEWSHYFTALTLTGQPERAVKVMFDAEGASEAVHMAILAHENKLLAMAPVTEELVRYESATPTRCQLNLARLINIYTKTFELTDIPRSLDYWYFLKGVEGPTRGDIFETAVSRAVYLTGEIGLILGKRTKEGGRTAGLIDDYEVAADTVIDRVARDSLIGGSPADAIALFLLAGNYDKAVEVSCDRLVSTIRNQTEIAETTAEAMELFYLATDNPGRVAPSAHACLCQLLDTVNLLRKCAEGSHRETLSMLRKVRFVPVDQESLSAALADFHRLPAKVRDVLPEICLELTKLVVGALTTAGEVREDRERNELKRLAEAIFVYAASVPHKFPAHVNTKMLEMQSALS